MLLTGIPFGSILPNECGIYAGSNIYSDQLNRPDQPLISYASEHVQTS